MASRSCLLMYHVLHLPYVKKKKKSVSMYSFPKEKENRHHVPELNCVIKPQKKKSFWTDIGGGKNIVKKLRQLKEKVKSI